MVEAGGRRGRWATLAGHESRAVPAFAPFEAEHLRERAWWMVKLRWVAVVGVVAAVAVATAIDAVSTTAQLLVIAGAMCVHNAVLTWWLRSHRDLGLGQLELTVMAQLLLDFLALSLLLHFADSIENPFVMLFAFPAAMGAMLLPPRLAFALSISAAAFHSGLIVAEYVGALHHHEFVGAHAEGVPDPLFHSAAMLVGYIGALGLLLLGVTYFVSSVATRQRHAHALWRERERVAQSRERMARVGQIAAGVAHSVRNPLHGLINARDLLTAHVSADPSAQRTLELMEEALRRLDNVTRRLLVLTRDAPLAPRPTDVDELVRETRDMLVSSRAGETSVPIVLELGSVGVAQVDPDQLSEALANIVHNAVHACESGGEVRVMTRSSTEGSGRVIIEVRDTGMGIAPEDVPSVFDPFFTTKAVGTGTGLGLNIARRVVEEHGGEIQLESEVGVGTRVTVRLRRTLEPTNREAPRE